MRRPVLSVTLAAVVTGALAFQLAPLGTNALYAVVGVIGLGLVAYIVRAELAPPLRDAIDRGHPSRFGSRSPGRRSALGRVIIGVTATAGAGLVAWVAAQMGTKAVIGAVAVVLGAVALWLFWPLLRDLMQTPPEDLAPRAERADDGGARSASPAARAVGTAMAVLAAGMTAWAAAQMGVKGLLALVLSLIHI